MAVTINAKGTSTSTFAVGRDGISIASAGTITPPAGNDLTIALEEGNVVSIDAGTAGPALITTSDDQDLHINPAVGGGQYLVLVGSRWPVVDGTANQVLTTNGSGVLSWSSPPGTGTVSSVAATGNNGITVSGSPITTSGTITLGLGNITPTSVAATGTVSGSNLSGTNTGDQTITLTGDVTGSGTGSFTTTLASVNSNVGQFAVSTVNGKGLVTAATDLLATGDVTGMSSGASIALTLATVNSSPQTDQFRKITVNGKGLVTATSAVSSSDITTSLGYTPVNKAGDTMTGSLTAPAFIPNTATVPSNGLYLPAANTVGISTASTERARIDSSGRVGIGVTPSAWGSAITPIDINTWGNISGSTSATLISGNAYYDGTNWRYKSTDAAGLLALNASGISLNTAVSGTAGNTVPWNSGLVLDLSGNLGVNTTPAAWNSTYKAIDINNRGAFGSVTNASTFMSCNSYYDAGGSNRAKTTAAGTVIALDTTGIYCYTAPSVTAGSVQSFSERFKVLPSQVYATGVPIISSNDGTGGTQGTPGDMVCRRNSSQGAIYFGDSSASYLFGSSTTLSFGGSFTLFGTVDNSCSLGGAGNRWTVVYATTGTINTSDINTKTEIEDLSVAEKNVAIAIKGLIKKYKYKDAVALKGSAGARIHVGVIAQEVEQAFIDEGLDPHRYGLFCEDTWYEVPGQPVEPMDRPIVTAKTPGAVEVTRLGVRYEELFAFVIAAL